MKSLLSARRHTGIIESLEARIAPAQVFIGNLSPAVTQDIEYIEKTPPVGQTLFFTNTSATSLDPNQPEGDPLLPAGDAISQALDGAGVGTYYMRLRAGDQIFYFTGADSYQELIRVNSGFAIAYFVDYNHNNDYDDREFTGLSLGPNANVVVSEKIYGDVVTNLNTMGTLSIADDQIDINGVVSYKQGIGSLSVVGGSVFGNIYSGGTIQNLTVSGNVKGIYAGTATNGGSFDFFPNGPYGAAAPEIIPGGEGVISFIQPKGKAGASIKNASVISIGSSTDPLLPGDGIIQAGDGGFGAAGGKLKSIQVRGDNDGFQLLAGNGGAADAASGKFNGGAGGALKNIYVSGIVDPTPNSGLTAQKVILKSGFGGNGLSTGLGGDGGVVKRVFVGYGLNNGILVSSGDLFGDSVLIEGGAGGSGKVGGLGGGVVSSKVRVQTPDSNGLEISLLGGAGGGSTDPVKGKAGPGGAIFDVEVRNQILTFDSDVLLAGGRAGTTVGDGKGAEGGSVTDASVLGFDVQVIAGDGSDGKKGGAGGSVNSLRLLEDERILSHNVLINAGRGGNGNQKAAGPGGTIQGVRVDNGDFQTFIINSGSQGNGGTSIAGIGGLGGSVGGLDIFDTDTGFSLQGTIQLRSGDGGDGGAGGGDGGFIGNSVVTALNNNITAKAGDGGDAMVKGSGGKGGVVNSVRFTSDGAVFGTDVLGQLVAGAGGDGIGKGGKGGKGGAADFVNLNVDGSAVLVAGAGGDGQVNTANYFGGAPGKGGRVRISGVFAKNGTGELRAGDAGAVGNAPAAGGSIFGGTEGELVGLRAFSSLMVVAGNGSHGGVGGSISQLSYGSTADSLTPTPSGNILIQAGQGSAEGKVAGAGGSLALVNGAVSSGVGSQTALLAGNGGGIVSVGLPVSEIVVGDGGTNEVQRIDLLSLVGITKAAFTVAVSGQTTPVIPINLPPKATAKMIKLQVRAIQAAIDAATGTPGVIVVSSVLGSPTQFDFTFNATGDQPPLVVTGYTGSKAGAGGSISEVAISLGGGEGVNLKLEAGNGGSAAVNGKAGGAGGDVAGVGMTDLDPLTILRSIGAGDGGAAKKFGGAGGSVLNISVQDHDIGIRNGEIFGYDKMGGVFVGAGGKTSAVNGVNGLAGNALSINANAIASIVAGKTLVPELAEKVSNIFLNGSKQLVVRDGALVGNSPFTLTLNGDTTNVIPGNATKLQVQTALNQLASVKNTSNPPGTGTVTVSDGVDGTYIVTFTQNGDQLLLTGEEQVPTEVVTLVQGAITAFSTVESNPGAVNPVVLETTSGQRSLTVLETISGDTVFSSAEQTRGDDFANPGVLEVQRISLINLAPYPTGQFTLTFGANTTVPLPGNATAANIQTALNQLASVIAVGGVTVAPGANATFNITFQVAGDQPPINGNLLVPESQRVTLGDLPNFGTAGFTLAYGADTTTLLASNANAGAIDAALEALPSIQALAGTLNNKVTVTNSAPGVFDVRFNSNGQKVNLVGTGFLPEVQQVNLDTLPSFPSAKFALSFGGSTTAQLPATADAATIDAALEGLTSIQALTGPAGNQVSVVKTSTNVFSVTFNSNGDQTPLIVIGSKPEVQTLDIATIAATFGAEFTLGVSHFVNVTEKLRGTTNNPDVTVVQEGEFALVIDESNGTALTSEVQTINLGPVDAAGETFTLVFDGESIAAPLPFDATAGDVELALNALVGIQQAGTVTVTGAVGGPFDVTFTVAGDQFLLTGFGDVSEAQAIDLKTLTDTLNNPGGEFTLSVIDKSTTPATIYQTVPLPQNATPGDVETALNNLIVPANLIGPGGVTVTAGAGVNEYLVTWNDAGDRDLLVSLGGAAVNHEIQTVDVSSIVGFAANGTFQLTFNGDTTAALPGNADATAIMNALNALPAVQNIQNDGLGSVTVSAGATAGVFDISFDYFGDQPTIVGVSKVGPNPAQIGSTLRLPYNATALDIENAINSVSQVQVSVVAGLLPGTFDITFNENGDQPAILGTGYIHETQNVDVYAVGDFLLRFNSKTTNRLSPAATAALIDAELEQLTSIQALSGPVGDKVEVAIGPNSSFTVLFHADGDVTPLGGTQFEPYVVTTVQNGTGSAGFPGTKEIQLLSAIHKGEFEAVYFSVANLVGAISDINEIDSNVFHYLHNGVLTAANDGLNGGVVRAFELGDTPIDGIVMAKVFRQELVNFTPEAKLTLTGFFDFNNVI